jgi:hypothetical protein
VVLYVSEKLPYPELLEKNFEGDGYGSFKHESSGSDVMGIEFYE